MAERMVFIDALPAYLVGNFGEIKFRFLRGKPNFDPGVSAGLRR